MLYSYYAIEEHRWSREGTLNVLLIRMIGPTFCSLFFVPVRFGGTVGPAQGLGSSVNILLDAF